MFELLGCNTTKKKENGQMAGSQEPGLSYQSTTTPYGTHASVTVVTSNKDTKFDQGADHTAYHPEDVHILHAHPPKSNHDHDIIGPDDEAEYKYIKHAHISKNVTAIAHATGLKKLGGMHVGKSGRVVLIFVATLFAAGVMPITVTWAKGSTGHREVKKREPGFQIFKQNKISVISGTARKVRVAKNFRGSNRAQKTRNRSKVPKLVSEIKEKSSSGNCGVGEKRCPFQI